jgi:hypothetical protein
MTFMNWLIIMLFAVISNSAMYYFGMRHGVKMVKKELDTVYAEHTLSRQSHRLSTSYRDWRAEAKKYNNKPNDVEDYIFENRDDAAMILSNLSLAANRYGCVSLSDYYDLIKVKSHFSDNSYGWKDGAIVGAAIVRVSNGYMIKFPPLEVI